MFGYVKAYKPELRIKEFEFYKAVYCSLCRDLGKKYGLVSRFSLSYDFTFLALLKMSLEDGCINTKRKACVCNPFKKCNYLCDGALPEMPTAAAQIMLYSKLCDNISDEGFLKGSFYRILRLFSKKGYRKACSDYPELKEIFDRYITEQNSIESKNLQDVDLAADPTAQMLSRLFELCGSTESDRRALNRMGYCMGRWIYILDAAADLKDDLKKGRYNPFSDLANEQKDIDSFVRERIEGSLNFCINESISAFELIDIKRFKNILGNIIYVGLEDSQNSVLRRTDK